MHAMTAIELHGIWERYVEDSLVAGLNHDPRFFVDQGSTGVNTSKIISTGVERDSAPIRDYLRDCAPAQRSECSSRIAMQPS